MIFLPDFHLADESYFVAGAEEYTRMRIRMVDDVHIY